MCCAIPLYRTHVFVITFVPDLYKAVRIYPGRIGACAYLWFTEQLKAWHSNK